jgi:hypothetical protein
VSPARPDDCSSAVVTWAASIPASVSSHNTRPGSTEPDRVFITNPSRGVKPMVVSTETPPLTAHSDAPAPRWQVTMRRSVTGRPTSSAARREAYRCERPWKPNRRSPHRRRHSSGRA